MPQGTSLVCSPLLHRPCQQQCWHRLHFAQHPHIDELLWALFFLRGDVWISVDLQTRLPGLVPEHSASISLMTFLCPPRSRSRCQLSGLWKRMEPPIGSGCGLSAKGSTYIHQCCKKEDAKLNIGSWACFWDAFWETGRKMKERKHLTAVVFLNFGLLVVRTSNGAGYICGADTKKLRQTVTIMHKTHPDILLCLFGLVWPNTARLTQLQGPIRKVLPQISMRRKSPGHQERSPGPGCQYVIGITFNDLPYFTFIMQQINTVTASLDHLV